MSKKKKPLIVLAVIGGIIISLLVAARITGALIYFKTPSSANLPALKVGDEFFSSNLVSSERFDFITFYYTDSMQGKHVRVYRLCGMPGDKIAIKAGNLYVNDKSADTSLNLRLMYLIPDAGIMTVTEHFNLSGDDEPIRIDSGKAIVFLSKEQTKELTAMKIPCERYLHGKTQPPPPEIEAIYHQPWTLDDFGPIQVPKDHYFVLGDNRYNAADSRLIGLIKKSDLHGVVLGVK
ncbi:signal peptidase I [Pseudoflavitalea sp. X16]|uniref:signal peptidase I n=1 Tax=Paraflavitalea devenefica TaxID=2716334 RepID=UPI00141EE4FF|nr:signal peptidase I [Paraflavitalea devenefica]NII26526.1 signal peptidase I [Paraflavitalea devenefica]